MLMPVFVFTVVSWGVNINNIIPRLVMFVYLEFASKWQGWVVLCACSEAAPPPGLLLVDICQFRAKLGRNPPSFWSSPGQMWPHSVQKLSTSARVCRFRAEIGKHRSELSQSCAI